MSSKPLTVQDIRKLEDSILRIESAVMRIELALKTPAKGSKAETVVVDKLSDRRLEALEERINKLISWMPGLANSR